MNNKTTFYRVTTSDKENFSRYGDTIAVTERYDTDSVFNLTTGMSYTYGGEQGTIIPNINEFPLFNIEKENLKKVNA